MTNHAAVLLILTVGQLGAINGWLKLSTNRVQARASPICSIVSMSGRMWYVVYTWYWQAIASALICELELGICMPVLWW